MSGQLGREDKTVWYFTEIADWWEGKRKETDAMSSPAIL